MSSPSRSQRLILAERLLGGVELTIAEQEKIARLLEASLGPGIAVPDSNLIPWPDADELGRLAERSTRRRRNEEAGPKTPA